jgi:pimeloyl-ACP methyl ester carboxylesterase
MVPRVTLRKHDGRSTAVPVWALPDTGAAHLDRAPAAGPVTAVVLPGSGSDDVFVRAAFAGPLNAAGIRLVAPAPRRGADVVAGHRAALDTALADPTTGTLLVGGVSLGAQVAAAWAADRLAGGPRRVGGLLLALPAWTGPPAADAPAAVAARLTAAAVRRGGVDAAVAAARAGAPRWLADELDRAWRGYGSGLADALEAAAAEPAPDAATLAGLALPTGVVGLRDDPVHPLVRAREWQALLPRAVLHTTTMAVLGADPAVLGRAAVRGWRRASTLSRRGGVGPPGGLR